MEHLGEFIGNHLILVTLFIVLAGLVVLGPLQQKLSGATELSVNQAVQLINQQNGQFVDVREAAAFNKEHIADAMNAPLAQLDDKLEQLTNLKKPIVLVCTSGQQAHLAAKKLQAQDDIYLLKGGLNAWKEAKLPLFS